MLPPFSGWNNSQLRNQQEADGRLALLAVSVKMVPFFAYSSTLKLEKCSSETWVYFT
jgi:hypothetical protein